MNRDGGGRGQVVNREVTLPYHLRHDSWSDPSLRDRRVTSPLRLTVRLLHSQRLDWIESKTAPRRPE